MPAWPETLPARFERNGFKESMPSNALVTQMDAGPPKRRRRFTAGVSSMTGTMVMNSDQVEDLITFFETTVEEVLPFTFLHPRTAEEIDVVFAGAPDIVPFGANTWRVSISFEVQP